MDAVLNEWPEVLTEVSRLRSVLDEETEPYKSRYEAGDVAKAYQEKLAAARAAAAPASGSDGDTDPSSLERSDLLVAAAKCLRGLSLAETDLLSEARSCLEEGAGPVTDAVEGAMGEEGRGKLWGKDLHALLLIAAESLNALGALEVNRGEPAAAQKVLERSESLLQRAQSSPACLTDALDALSMSESDTDKDRDKDKDTSDSPSDALLRLATMTSYFLAQVYTALGRREESASYVCSTLLLQLQTGQWSPNDWLSNCLGMAVYFMDWGDMMGSLLLLLSGDLFVDWSAAEGGRGPDEDLVAQLHSRLGRLHLRVLATAAKLREAVRQEGLGAPPVMEDDQLLTRSLAKVPSTVVKVWRFLSSSLGRDDDVRAAMGHHAARVAPDRVYQSFDAARDAFNEGMRWYKRSLERFQLDGWVTDHFGVQLEVSALFRCLQEFDPSVQRRVAMHRERVKRLEPILKCINTEVYEGVAQSLRYELAQAHRDIVELLTGSGAGPLGAGGLADDLRPTRSAPPAAVLPLIEAAARLYNDFVAASHGEQVVSRLASGKRLSDEDLESLEDDLLNILNARLQLARVLHRGCGYGLPSDVAYLKRAHLEVGALLDLYKRHPLPAFETEARMSAEFRALLQSRIGSGR